MNEKLLHTPEGVRDIYDAECKKKKKVISQIHHVLELYSYQDIDTPSFEYFDIFNMDKGSAASNEMYKFFDRNNNTLVLRPDITPSIARSVAKYYPEEQLPIRLCYAGNTFLNTHQHQGKLSEFTQIGGELINDDSSAADAEIIACVIHCLLAAGLKEFQIEIGEVEFFKGMIEEAGLDDETEQRIKEYIHSKNFFGLTEFVNTLEIPEERKTALKSFESLFGGLDMLDHAEKLVTNAASLEAIARMRKVYTALTSYGYEYSYKLYDSKSDSIENVPQNGYAGYDVNVDLDKLRDRVAAGETIAQAFVEIMQKPTTYSGEPAQVTNNYSHKLSPVYASDGKTVTGLKFTSQRQGTDGESDTISGTKDSMYQYPLDFGKLLSEKGVSGADIPEKLDYKGLRVYCATCLNQWFN